MDLIDFFSSLLSAQAWYGVIFLFSFLESLVVIGLLTPGTLMILFAGFLISGGRLDFYPVFFLTILGAVLGDLISFYLGEKGVKLFKEEAKILKITRLKNGQEFFKKHGGKSIFFGRFIGPLRSVVPFTAGTFKMDYKKFLFWNLTSAAFWAFSYLFLGLIFGEAWQTAERFATGAQIVLSIIALLIIAFYLINLYLISSEGKLTIKTATLISNLIRKKIIKFGIFRFIFARFRKKDFYGLPLTVLAIAFFYVLFLAFGFVRSFILSGVIYGSDIRIENLLFVFRDDELIRYFYFLTLLGNWQIIISFGIVLSVVFWLWKKKAYIFALWIAVLGTQLFNVFGKIAFNRPRPQSAIFLENSTSFPSGHSAIAIAFYGFIAYVLLRTKEGKRKKLAIFMISFILIFLIGLSRMYLGFHYFSDVIGGYLLGFLWLIIAISIFEWAQYKHKIKNLSHFKLSLKTKKIIFTLLIAQLFFYVVFAANYKQQLNLKIFSQKNIVTNKILDPFYKNELTRYSETLRGSNQEPMSFLIVAKTDDELVNLFKKSEWYGADYFNRNSIARMVIAAFLDQSYPTNVITPSFWNSKVHDFGFQKPSVKNTIKERHHVRFWKTNIFTKDNRRLYVGTASYDTDIKWYVTHKIDPNIDTEREYLFKDLLKSGLIKNYQKLQFVKPAKGKNFTGDSFYTDGKAYLIELK